MANYVSIFKGDEIDATLSTVPNKVDKVAGKGLSEANFTNAEKTKLASAAPLASPAFTGVPTAPTAALGTNNTQLSNTAFVQQEIQQVLADLAEENSSTLIAGLSADQVSLASKITLDTFVTPEQFGAVGNGVTLDTSAIKLWLESPKKKIAKRNAVYNIGNISGDSFVASTNGINHDIDFNFCKFVCAGNVSATYTSTCMLQITNGTLVARNLAGFNDLNFASRGAGRGVCPWIIINTGVNTYGYILENIVIDDCQSFGTFGSENPTYQARNIKLAGCYAKGNVERGITLSDSGSDVSGDIFLNGEFNRQVFARNISNVNLNISGGTATGSSGNILIYASSGIEVSNIQLKIHNRKIFSCSLAALDDTASFKNIDIDIWADTIGDPLVEVIRFGAQDMSGNWLTTSNFSSKSIKFKIRSNIKQFVEFGMQTYSTNVDVINLDTYGDYMGYLRGQNIYFRSENLAVGKYQSLPSNATPITFDTSILNKNVSRVQYEVFVKGFSGSNQHLSKYLVSAFRNSLGVLTTFVATLVYQQNSGAVSSALSSSGGNIVATFSGFSGVIEAYISIKELDY